MAGLIYLAGAIDGVTADEARDWREAAASAISSWGFAVYTPAHAFITPEQAGADPWTAKSVITVNDLALRLSDAVLANLGSARMFGTPVECSDALRLGIPVFVFGGAELSLYRHRFKQQGCWEADIGDAMPYLRRWAEKFEPRQVEQPPVMMRLDEAERLVGRADNSGS